MAKGQKAPAVEEAPGTRKLLGVFSAAPPLCLGELYQDKRQLDGRTKGKQFGAGHLKYSIAAPGSFEASKCLAAGELYQENFKYSKIYDADKRKKGFLSSDFPKRDEFSNTMRTEQLREVLRKEQVTISERMQEEEEEEAAAIAAGQRPAAHSQQKKSYLYDVVTRQVPTSFKFHRDDRQGKFFYMNERKKDLAATAAATIALGGNISTSSPTNNNNNNNFNTFGKTKTTSFESPTWVNVTVGGRLLTVLLDTQGNVIAQQPGVTDVRNSAGIEEHHSA